MTANKASNARPEFDLSDVEWRVGQPVDGGQLEVELPA